MIARLQGSAISTLKELSKTTESTMAVKICGYMPWFEAVAPKTWTVPPVAVAAVRETNGGGFELQVKVTVCPHAGVCVDVKA